MKTRAGNEKMEMAIAGKLSLQENRLRVEEKERRTDKENCGLLWITEGRVVDQKF